MSKSRQTIAKPSSLVSLNRKPYEAIITSFSSIIMARTIKLFRCVQHSYRLMGIYSPHSTQIYTFNRRKLFIFLSLTLCFLSRLGYFLFKTNFIEENGFKACYQSIGGLVCVVDFLLNIWQMPLILQLIKMFDEFIEKSE